MPKMPEKHGVPGVAEKALQTRTWRRRERSSVGLCLLFPKVWAAECPPETPERSNYFNYFMTFFCPLGTWMMITAPGWNRIKQLEDMIRLYHKEAMLCFSHSYCVDWTDGRNEWLYHWYHAIAGHFFFWQVVHSSCKKRRSERRNQKRMKSRKPGKPHKWRPQNGQRWNQKEKVPNRVSQYVERYKSRRLV